MMKGHKFRTFLAFLCISALLWSIEKIRQTYTVSTTYGIHCVNIPEEYIIDEEKISALRVWITGGGVDLMMMPNDNKRYIDIDVSRLNRRTIGTQTVAVIAPRRFTTEVSNVLPDQITLNRVEGDTIYVPLLTKKRKYVPVIVTEEPKIEKQHIMSAPSYLDPDHVWISGTNDKIDTMEAVYTKKLEHEITLKDTIYFNLEYDLPDGVEASSMNSQITYFVEPFTEKNLNVPVTAVNIPKGYTFKAFPPMVRVTVAVGVSQYDKVGENDIDILADLTDIKPGSSQKKIKLKLTSCPQSVKSISYSPLFVEYLLEHRHERKETEQ